MKCKTCSLEIPKNCSDCGADLTKEENIICGSPIIPKNHCHNCWRKK